MSYENGQWINRHYAKIIGKTKQKKVHDSNYYAWWLSLKNKYWKHCYLSGVRKLAKQQTNRKLRQESRNLYMKLNEDNEIDNFIPRNGQYRKILDYDWILD